MYKSGRGRSAPLSQAQFLKAFDQQNLLTLKNCVHFTQGITGSGASFTPARKSRQDIGARSYYSGYVFKADTKVPYKVFQEGFEPLPLQMVEQAGQAATSRYRIQGGVVASLSAIAAGYLMVQNLGLNIYVYLVDATSYSGMLEHEPNMPAAYRYLQPNQVQSCDVLYTHPIFNTDIIGCVWSSQFPGPELAKTHWPPRVALGPVELSLAVNPEYDKGMEKAEEVAALFSIG